MTVKIRAEPVAASDLKPGDLFHTYNGPDHWEEFSARDWCSESIQVRANGPADFCPDNNTTVYRLAVVHDGPSCDFCHGGASAGGAKVGGVVMCGDCFAVFEQACTPGEVNP